MQPGLARAGRAGDEDVRHAREVGPDGSAGDVLAEPDRQRARRSRQAVEDVAERDELRDDVRDLHADRLLAGDGREDADLGRRERVGEVVLRARRPSRPSYRARATLVARDARAGTWPTTVASTRSGRASGRAAARGTRPTPYPPVSPAGERASCGQKAGGMGRARRAARTDGPAPSVRLVLRRRRAAALRRSPRRRQEVVHGDRFLSMTTTMLLTLTKFPKFQMNYNEVMGVPITFIDKYNPKQFELLGIMNTGEKNVGIRYKQTPHGETSC